MTDSLKDYTDFLSLLLKSSVKQRKAILNTLDAGQVDFIRDLMYNFLNTFPIPKKELKKLYKKKDLMEIANYKKSNRFRNHLIRKNIRTIIDILSRHSKKLLTLL